MIYDFNPIYGHLQECWTGCKSVKDHKILMRTAEIHLGELPSLPRAASWGQEDVALPSSQLAETGGWGGDKKCLAGGKGGSKGGLFSESMQGSGELLSEEHYGSNSSSEGLPQRSFTWEQGFCEVHGLWWSLILLEQLSVLLSHCCLWGA